MNLSLQLDRIWTHMNTSPRWHSDLTTPLFDCNVLHDNIYIKRRRFNNMQASCRLLLHTHETRTIPISEAWWWNQTWRAALSCTNHQMSLCLPSSKLQIFFGQKKKASFTRLHPPTTNKQKSVSGWRFGLCDQPQNAVFKIQKEKY